MQVAYPLWYNLAMSKEVDWAIQSVLLLDPNEITTLRAFVRSGCTPTEALQRVLSPATTEPAPEAAPPSAATGIAPASIPA